MFSQELLSAIFLSLFVGTVSTLLNLPGAMGTVLLLTRSPMRGKTFLEGAVSLPLVMPPVTTGYLLLIFLGKQGFLGGWLFRIFGLRIAFTTTAAVIASMAVSFPLIVKNIKASMEMVDQKLEQAAATLGAGPVSVFFRITLPIIFPGVISGAVLGFARSLGEFGATMIFAGNIEGATRTIPLSVYSLLQIPGKEREAAILVGISVLVSFSAMFLSTIFTRRGKIRAAGRDRDGT